MDQAVVAEAQGARQVGSFTACKDRLAFAGPQVMATEVALGFCRPLNALDPKPSVR